MMRQKKGFGSVEVIVMIALALILAIGVIYIFLGPAKAAQKAGTCVGPPPGLICADKIVALKDNPTSWSSCPAPNYDTFTARTCSPVEVNKIKYEVACCMEWAPSVVQIPAK